MNTALVLIDLQKGFNDHQFWGGNRNNPEMEENIKKLLTAFRNVNAHIIHVKHNSTSPDSLLRPGQEGNELLDFASPQDNEPLFGKEVNSAFIGTELEGYLKKSEITTLILVGLTTNHCVSTTARMAGNLGFRNYVVSDAVATFDRVGPDGKLHTAEEIHAISLANIHGEFSTIVSTNDILQRLMQMT